MTKQQLEQYRYMRTELRDLDERIRKGELVSDIVIGSNKESPYIKGPVKITGYIHDAETAAALRKRRALLLQACQEIEQWMECIEDSLTRQIVRLRYVDGYHWWKVALKIGCGNTADSVRKALMRYLEKH